MTAEQTPVPKNRRATHTCSAGDAMTAKLDPTCERCRQIAASRAQREGKTQAKRLPRRKSREKSSGKAAMPTLSANPPASELASRPTAGFHWSRHQPREQRDDD
jgi:hypothetical protein